MADFFGKTLLFKELTTGEEWKGLTHNGLTWLINTKKLVPVATVDDDGDPIPEEDIQWEEQMAVYPWERFIKGFVPIDKEAVGFVRDCLLNNLKGYREKIQATVDYIESLEG